MLAFPQMPQLLPTGSGRAGAAGAQAAAELHGDRVEAPFRRRVDGVAVAHGRDLRRSDQAFGDEKPAASSKS